MAASLTYGNRNQHTFDPRQNAYVRPHAEFSTYSAINTGSGGNAVTVTGSPGFVYGIDLMNNVATIVYFKLYDKATAPTSADTPVRRYMIPAEGGLVRVFVNDLAFTNGIGFRIVTGIADNNTTDPSANTILINIDWGST